MQRIKCCALPTWWFWRGGCTRSHSEHGRETPQRRWYFVLRRGRVGRCQVCKAQQKQSIFSKQTKLPKRATKKGRTSGLYSLKQNKQSGARAAPSRTKRPKPQVPTNKQNRAILGAQIITRGKSSPEGTKDPKGSRIDKTKNPGLSPALTNNAGWSSPEGSQRPKPRVPTNKQNRAITGAQIITRGGAAR